MAHQTIELKKVTPHAGAEIHGVDLSRPLGERTFEEIQRALAEHCVIFLPRPDAHP